MTRVIHGFVLVSMSLTLAVVATLAGDPAYDEGIKLYKSTEYEKAILRLEEVAVRPDLAAADKSDVLMWLGLSYAGTGDLEQAKKELRAALVADDDLTLPPNTSPRVVSLFEELRTSVKAEKAEAAAAAAAEAKRRADEEARAHANDPPPSPPPEDHTGMLIAGGATAGVGALALVGAGVLGVVAMTSLSEAQSKSGFQDDDKRALDTANGTATGALILVPVGVVLAGAGVTLMLLE
jgi:hypothetical protein